ncbi:uncharacterized protein MONBRDRAFT_32636 [Monosiga brevicollis MX1]|uniref:LamG-like jellyroll fold domain-containing protein n=1 Tax=Monosiga brevicollis TaxID=81824 RepID=A9V0U5_MONBE|nr:uncharacterized protein MONBRDRAFT_32636 [Monosiga brevicollis MX1]EDQ88697.1 predicted protein [Monosiga brevicollis MX1]|eukprot:XP_001746310.1 hypothetical protein [Monosiga brevicollis MX1]
MMAMKAVVLAAMLLIVAWPAVVQGDDGCPDPRQSRENGVCKCADGFVGVNSNTACTLRNEIYTISNGVDPAQKAIVIQGGNITLRTYNPETHALDHTDLLKTLRDLADGHGSQSDVVQQLLNDVAAKADANDVNALISALNTTLQATTNNLFTLQNSFNGADATLQQLVQDTDALTTSTTDTSNPSSLASMLASLDDQVQTSTASAADLATVSAALQTFEAEADDFVTKSDLHRYLPGAIASSNMTGPCNATVLGVLRSNNQTQQYETCRRAETWNGDVYFWHPMGLPQFCIKGEPWTATCTECIAGYVASLASHAPCQIQADLLHMPFDNNLWDLSTNRRNVLFFGTASETLFGRTGLDGSPALQLRGAEQHLRAPPNVIGGAFSVCVSIVFDNFGLYSRIFDFSTAPEGTQEGGNSNILMLNRDTSNDFLQPPLICHVYHAQLYKNGDQIMQLTEQQTIPFLRRTSNYIGRSNFGNNPDFDGAIDNLRMWSRELTPAQIADITLETQGVQRPAMAQDGDALLLHYTFENSLRDVSGTGNDGVAFNHHAINLYQVNAPEGNTSLYLDGVNDYILAPPLSFDNAITVCSWVRYRSLNEWSRVADFNNGGPESIFIGNQGQSTNLEFTFLFDDPGVDSPLIVAGGFNWAYGGFQHYCFTNAGAVSIVYRQGREVGRKTDVRTRSAKEYHNIFIGRSAWDADGYLGANLDDYRVYNYALSPEAVHDMLCQGRSDLDCVGLIGHWKFDGDVRDASGNEWHGELVPVSLDIENHFFEDDNVAVGSGALYLPGNGSWVQLPARNFGGDFTICTWIQTRRAGGWERIVDFGTNGNRMYIARVETQEALVLDINGQVVTAALPAGTADDFIHMCAFSNSTGGYLAYNGQVVNGNTDMAQMPVGWLDVNYIGKSAASASDAALDAVLDDLRIYDHVLSPSDMAQLASQA